MSRNPSTAASAVDSEDLIDISTAPTTPDGSLTFSPVLQALKLRDALEDERRNSPSLRTSNPSVKNICCIGAGYVGGPTAAVMAYQNPHLNITVVDRDPTRIAQWKSRHLPIYEPGLHEILRIARDGSKACSFYNEISVDNLSSTSSATSECESQCGRDEICIPARKPNLYFSTEVSKAISEADVILIAVNTPTKMRGLGAGKATDVTALEAVTKQIAIHAKPSAILVEKSTVPCRTAQMIRDILTTHRPNEYFEVLSNPEFLAAGTAIEDLLSPDRVVIGSSPTPAGLKAASVLAGIYSWVPSSRIVTLNTYSAELAKLVANSMLAQRISSINSISAICEKTGADISEIAHAVGMDPRIGDKYLKSGIGFGGSCFRKDLLSLIYLAETLGLEEVAQYWQQVLKVNEWQRERFARRVVKRLNGTLDGKKIGVLGYAFKKDTDDTRESPAGECIKILLEDYPAEIAVFDPCCRPEVIKADIVRLVGKEALRENGGPVGVYGDVYEATKSSHAILIMTDCDEFKHCASAVASTPRQESKSKFPDPRPFSCLEPKESEILALQKHLASVCSMHDQDTLDRLIPEPECEENCRKCSHLEDTVLLSEVQIGSYTQERKEKQRLDWQRIAYHLETPKWVFDGRGMFAEGERTAMGGWGVRVEGIGRVEWGELEWRT